MDGGESLLGLYQSALNGEWPHAGEDIAAVALIADQWLIHGYLCKGVVHIGIGTGGGLHDGYLAGDRLCAAQSVDLGLAGAAHQVQQQRVPRRPVCGHIALQQIDALAGSGAKKHGGQQYAVSFVCHGCCSFCGEKPWG